MANWISNPDGEMERSFPVLLQNYVRQDVSGCFVQIKRRTVTIHEAVRQNIRDPSLNLKSIYGSGKEKLG